MELHFWRSKVVPVGNNTFVLWSKLKKRIEIVEKDNVKAMRLINLLFVDWTFHKVGYSTNQFAKTFAENCAFR